MKRSRDAQVEIRSMDDPDEARAFPMGRSAVARFGRGTVSGSTLEHGWVWSRDVGHSWDSHVVSGRLAGRQ